MADIGERNQIVTFLKYLALKSAQVIVQSRGGVKVVSSAKSKNSDQRNDWFNLAIPDDEKVSILTKTALKGETEYSLKQMLCIDIHLKFPEGDEFLLETWTLELNQEKDLKQVCSVNEVYHRMGTLLKSLLTITRLQPAYKLARKQEGEPYSINYRVYCGDPEFERLGPLIKTINVGKIVLAIGTIKLAVKYTTDLAVGPNRRNKQNEIIVKSDHFTDNPRRETGGKKIDLNKPLSTGAFVDKDKIDKLHRALQENLPPEPPMSWVLSQLKESPEKEKEDNSAKATGCNHGECSENAKSKAIAMPKKKTYPEDQMYSKKLEFPFADGSPITELANFYHECMTARSQTDEWCDGTEEHSSVNSVESLNNQLKAFENAVPEFDNMVASMFSSSSENE